VNRGCIQLFKNFGVEVFIPHKFPTFLRNENWVSPEKTAFFVGNVMGKIFDPNHPVTVTYLDKIERNKVTLLIVEDSEEDSDEDSDEEVEADNAEDIDETAISDNNESEGDGSFYSVSKFNIESEDAEDGEEAVEKEESSSSAALIERG